MWPMSNAESNLIYCMNLVVSIGGNALLGYFGYLAGNLQNFGYLIGVVIGVVLGVSFNRQDPKFDDGSCKKRISPKCDDDKSSELSQCSICLEPFKHSILLIPCLHMCFCDTCYKLAREKKIKHCPICRKNIKKAMSVYPS